MADSVDALLVCAAGYVSGKEIMTLTLAQGLQRNGGAVHVLSSTWNDGDFVQRLGRLGVDHSQMRLGFISATLRLDCIRMTGEQLLHWPGLAWRYRRLLRRLRPRRVVHTNWHHLLLLLPLLRPSRDLMWVHEVIPDSKRYANIFARLSARLGAFIAVSHAVARALVSIGVPAHKVIVLHNGIPPIDLPSTDPVDRRAPCIAIVGQVGDWKGHADLVEAFALLSDRHKTLTLRVVGRHDSAFASGLKARLATLGLTERVDWAGFIRDRGAIYKAVDICVVPSRSNEPLSTTAIEASSCGIPVVATTRGGFPEIVVDGVTGLLVPAGSPKQLADAISRLLDDEALRKDMGLRAQSRMREEFSELRFVGDFTQVLAKPMGSS